MMGFTGDFIRSFLEDRRRRGLMRSLSLCVHSGDGLNAEVCGKRVRLFCTNDYLALSGHSLLQQALKEGAELYGMGSTASRLIAGTHAAHIGLEERLKRFLRVEAVLLFNSGWHLNTSVLPALADRDTEIFCDRLVHASIIDGAILSRATIRRYPHLDLDALESMLKRSRAKRRLIVTEGVFSMDGHIPSLDELLYLASRYNAPLLLDDAHGFGVMGSNGRGTHSHFGLDSSEWLIYAGTLGKAAGSYGAFIAADRELIDYLINSARGFIFSTALPPALCHATIKAIDLIEEADDRRDRLFIGVRLLREGLGRMGLLSGSHLSPVVPLIVGNNHSAVELSERLLERGFFVQPIRYPTVPEGTARLRITLSAAHRREDIEELLEAIGELKAEMGL